MVSIGVVGFYFIRSIRFWEKFSILFLFGFIEMVFLVYVLMMGCSRLLNLFMFSWVFFRSFCICCFIAWVTVVVICFWEVRRVRDCVRRDFLVWFISVLFLVLGGFVLYIYSFLDIYLG